MKDFHTAHNRFLKSLIQQSRQETLQYVKNGMEQQLSLIHISYHPLRRHRFLPACSVP